jgi:homoserine dehydrogenase
VIRPELALVLIGFGNVARRFVRLLGETADRVDFTWKVVAISTRHHGSVIDADGVDTHRALQIVESKQSLDARDPRSGLDVIRQVADRCADEAAEARLVCIETTVLDIDRGEPAVSHVRAALEAQAHVVTANKGPAAFAFHELDALAESVDRSFFFEGAVMDGVPVFNLVRETMPAVTIQGFRGVINTTCNFILSELERGLEFDVALAEMQRRGIAEADPSLDVDGWDAAAKTAALVNVLMGGVVTPHHVARSGLRLRSGQPRATSRGGIRDVSGADVRDAMARGRRIRLVASASRHGGKVQARVEPEMLGPEDPLAGVTDMQNALYLQTDLLGEIGIVQRSGDLTQTAYALLTDLAQISQRHTAH